MMIVLLEYFDYGVGHTTKNQRIIEEGRGGTE